MVKMETKLLTALEAAQFLGFSVSRIRYETFIKRIPHIKIGRSVRYVKEELEKWIIGQSVPSILE